MRTKQIPVALALLAGLITCIFSYIRHLDMVQFIKTLGLSVLIFFSLGIVIKLVIDRNFSLESDEIQDEQQELDKADTEKQDQDTDPTEEARNSREE